MSNLQQGMIPPDGPTGPHQDHLQRQLRQLRAVYRMSELVSRAGDLTTIYEAAIEALVEALHLDRASVLIFDPDGVLRFKAWRGLSDGYRTAVTGHSPWKQGESDPRAITIRDVREDEALENLRDVITGEGILSCAFIPLVGPRGLFGKFMLYCNEPHDFSEDEISLAEAVAHHIAFALERTRSEMELAASLERERATRLYVEKVNRLKDEFLATLSHELRTPLQAILGWSRLLLTEQLDPGQVGRAAEIIERNASIQARLIDDLLDMSRIISGKISLNVRKIDLTQVVRSALETVSSAIDARQINLAIDIAQTPPLILGDQERLQQVVWNLMSNAIKFTPRGGRIAIGLRSGGDHLELSITDSGEGIAAEFLPYVFERFLQADASTTRKQGGLGLGLAIVRNLVELHGGVVRAESPGPGQGATFRVYLPVPAHAIDRVPAAAAPEKANGQPRNPRVKLNGVKIVVLDDETDAREFVRFVLEESGAEVVETSTVEQALEELGRRRPDLIVSDIAMPECDGFEFIRRLRSLPPDAGGDIPVAALTALARSEDRMRVLESGFQIYLAKPIEPTTLVETVAKLVGTAR